EAAGQLASGHGADHAVGVADRQRRPHRLALLQRRPGQLEQRVAVERLVQPVVLRDPARPPVVLGNGGLEEDAAEVEVARLPVIDRAAHLDPLRAADHLVEGAEAQLGHVLAHLLGDEAHEVHHVVGLAGELGPVPPSWPEMSTTSACALATPAAMVPTPSSATSFTLMRASLLAFLRSWISSFRSSIE